MKEIVEISTHYFSMLLKIFAETSALMTPELSLCNNYVIFPDKMKNRLNMFISEDT